mgnify:CR=1 FL=1
MADLEHFAQVVLDVRLAEQPRESRRVEAQQQFAGVLVVMLNPKRQRDQRAGNHQSQPAALVEFQDDHADEDEAAEHQAQGADTLNVSWTVPSDTDIESIQVLCARGTLPVFPAGTYTGG